MSTNQVRNWDRIVWHAFTQMAEYEPLIIERGPGPRRLRYRRPPLSGRREQPVVQRARPSPSADRRRHPRSSSTAWPMSRSSAGRTRRRSALPATGRVAPPGFESRLLYRRRGHRGRSGAEDGLSILAAARRSASRTRPAHGAGMPITATRSARSAWAASRGFMPCSGRCCSSFRCLRRTSYRLPPGVTRDLLGAFSCRDGTYAGRTPRSGLPHW